ncbi:hypothetical protein [Cohnella algarum]|uniref:hypothetical protein n=1 Tax=Cohnella algarum TaxID=2044859 RepID=UPI0019684A4E|nr:hypothetical protein [Cohnella algarum]MBN2980081.1 hypothetical protein [Cohnella algarum]
MKDPKGVPTIEEWDMIRDMIVLPNLAVMLEQQRQKMEYTTQLLKPLYQAATDALIYAVSREHSKLRMEMQRRKIKVWDERQDNDIIYVQYNCRGYQNEFGVTREVVKTEMRLRLTQHIEEMERRLQGDGRSG